MTATARAVSGFTLLELLVAFSIMAMALGLFYRALGGNARAVDHVQRYQGAVVLAQSLLELRDSVPAGGWNDEGDSGGYHWRVQSQPYSTDAQGPRVPVLYQVSIAISWGQGSENVRNLALSTLRPERIPPVGIRP
ncbi:general secretion pathway protein GspI [Acidovorax sp. Leaf78]|nr:general secretion pathway protein GspI [Acidovorax sp. Leaf78]